MRKLLLTAVAVAAVASACNGEPKKPEAQVNHWKFWQVEPVLLERDVTLKGQFDEKPWTTGLDSIQYIGNPVKKTVDNKQEKAIDEKSHLVAYRLSEREKPAPPRWVKLSNQFGTSIWLLGDPFFLMLPAGKSFDPKPPPDPQNTADHYICYVVKRPEKKDPEKPFKLNFNPPLTLQDQFDRKIKKDENITSLSPAFFGVPVSKDGKKIVNSKVHLAIYDLDPTTTPEKPLVVQAKDQFRTNKLTAKESLLLAVPSLKLKWGKGEPPKK